MEQLQNWRKSETFEALEGRRAEAKGPGRFRERIKNNAMRHFSRAGGLATETVVPHWAQWCVTFSRASAACMAVPQTGQGFGRFIVALSFTPPT